jgi:hypothetical protein
MIIGVAIWCLALALYLMFAGALSGDEFGTAIVLASLSALWATLIRRQSRLRFAAPRGLFTHLAQAIAGVPGAVLRTGAVLMRAIKRGGSPGRAHETRFRYGSSGAKERARRAAAVFCASLAPDRFVVNVLRDHDAVLLHDLGARRGEPDDRWLT